MTEPYYQDELVTLYLGSCVFRPDKPDEPVIDEWLDADVLVTDPPYGMAFRSNQRKGDQLDAIEGDETTDIRDAALARWGAERPALMFGRWSVAPPAGERQRLIWAKADNPGMGDVSIPWGPAHEDIHLLGKGWNREATGLKRIGSVITTHGVRGGASGAENVTGHPTPKPVGLMESLIERVPAGVIADPFAGSGATLVAARNLGRRSIGVELKERYCEVIVRRLAQQAFDFAGLS